MRMKTLFLSVALIIISTCSSPTGPDKIPGGPGDPTINFTRIPRLGSFDDLIGKVLHVDPKNHKIVVFIFEQGAWWMKPHFGSLIQINSDGSWTADITTGGTDEHATEIIAYLVTNDYKPTFNRSIPATSLPAPNGTDILAQTRTRR
jgi:hypothetical protein